MKLIYKSRQPKTYARLMATASQNRGTRLGDVYTTYSSRKSSIWWEWFHTCKRTGGRNFRIVSHNCNFFSLAWDADDHTVLVTPSNCYALFDN